MATYCVKERVHTPDVPGSEMRLLSQNGRPIVRSVCASCGAGKSRFVSSKGGGLDIHKQILKIAPKKGFTLPGHRFTGPGNPLEEQVKWGPDGQILEVLQQPTGKTDAVSMQHDVDYAVCDKTPEASKLACKNKADRKMVKALDAIPWTERQWGHALARNAIQAKQKLGLGVKKRKI